MFFHINVCIVAQLQGNTCALRAHMLHMSCLRVVREFHANLVAARLAMYLHH